MHIKVLNINGRDPIDKKIKYFVINGYIGIGLKVTIKKKKQGYVLFNDALNTFYL